MSRRIKVKRYKGPELLRFAGMLGHTAVVTCDDGKGGERIAAETHPEWAAQNYRELGERARKIFYRIETPLTRGWIEVRYQRAMLDAKE